MESGSVVEGLVNHKLSTIFLDTGAMVNIISLNYLRKVKPGVVRLEPSKYVLQGVTGNQMNVLGEIKIPIELGLIFKFDIKAVVGKDSFFPGDLLIGYRTMKQKGHRVVPGKGRSANIFPIYPIHW